jgi:hypothetical protein
VTAPHPRETEERCALRAQLRGDPMIGTAFPAARMFLVEQPGSWGRDGLRDSDFDRTVAQRVVQRAHEAGLRTQAIRRPGRVAAPDRRSWAVADTTLESVVWGTFGDDAELLDVPLDAKADSDTAPVYLVCTHSKHDACCALRGRPVAAALDELRPGRVWETTHLGGDRFAANVLVLPSGLLYGHVPVEAAEGFVAAAESDQVLSGLLRGRVGHPPAVQAALAHAYDRLAVLNRRELDVVSSVRSGEETLVRIASPFGEHDITVRAERVDQEGLTCSNPGPNWYVRYRPVDIAAV